MAAVAVLSGAMLMGCAGAPGSILDDEALHQSYFRPGYFAGVQQIRRGPGCQIFHPVNMNYGRHPIIIWGNGTYASPADYRDLLEHWASHGFVVVAAMSPNAGSLSLAVSLPTMIIGFARYSQDQSFRIIAEQSRFLWVMAAGSIAGAFVGGMLLAIVASTIILPLLTGILLISAYKVWRHSYDT